MLVKFYDSIDDSLLKFAVIISKTDGKWVFCKHRERNTYEVPGGRREENETILECAKREFYEETGAIDFEITPICVYSVTGKTRVNETGEESFGMLYYADIKTFEKELHSEIEKVELFDELPEDWTYPLIQPLLIKEYIQRSYDIRINRIRESERKSHTEMYSNNELYKTDSWLSKPIKTVVDIIPLFQHYDELNVLDLGCGVGRNSIAIAQAYKDISCNIECVDLLELAINKLMDNAKIHDVDEIIHGIVKTIEEFQIEENKYDFIMAISALEHIDSTESFIQKLIDIRDGIRNNGIVCLVINSEVQEFNKKTMQKLDAQFEVNLPTEEMQKILQDIFVDWEILKSTAQVQQYDVPRENGVCELKTNVVTLVARKME